MAHFAVSAFGRDRPGIVAGLSEVLFELGGNIEDSQMSILRGHFAVMLIVATPEAVTKRELEEALTRLREGLGLEAVAVNEVDELAIEEAGPTHVLTVYGADHPGIVHSVSAALAERGVNITDLETRLTEGEDAPVYVMMMELALPSDCQPEELSAALRDVGEAGSFEVSLNRLEVEAL